MTRVDASVRQDALAFAGDCVAIDLEVGRKDGRIHQIGAVKRLPSGDIDHSHASGDAVAGLRGLDAFVQGSRMLLGHNLLGFDRPHLEAADPTLRLLALPVLDTLWLNPLAFPRNPYHHLVKHQQDGRLISGQRNNPVEDARTVLTLFADQFEALRRTPPAYLQAWHWLCSREPRFSGFDLLFRAVRQAPAPDEAAAQTAMTQCLDGKGCPVHARSVIRSADRNGWGLAYALAWISVSGGNSVVPPWVRHQFPVVSTLIRLLRETPCTDSGCAWCTQRHDATRELKRFFPDVPGFRPEPADAETGKPLQQAIVEAAMRHEHVLGILPTGTGKSLCYQVPTLSRFEKTGALTVVISPLVALMEDQINGLLEKGISCAAAINGMLTMPERASVLERLRLGDIGILVISPEQLRNRTVRQALKQREIGTWVFDEAHCVSKWGNDFRPDYRYASRYIRERAGDGEIPPIICLTATAKPDVIGDMQTHFRQHAQVRLRVINGGSERSNLSYAIIPATQDTKNDYIRQIIQEKLPPGRPGGVIVYCATRKHTETLAEHLNHAGIACGHFHAGLSADTKKEIQQAFIRGELQAITATNAFGMGIDKPDVRLVIHADIPGSLENYLQEAGRAGRDREPAECVLLYAADDVERQFRMSARSRLSLHDIRIILKAIKDLMGKRQKRTEIVATTGEILVEDHDARFERDAATDDTRVRTAVAWLEEAQILSRHENLVTVFPSSLKVASIEEARQRLAGANLFREYADKLLLILQLLFEADPDEGISTDTLMAVGGIELHMLRKAMQDLERLGLTSDDTALTAFVHVAVKGSSAKRLQWACTLEKSLIEALEDAAPDDFERDVPVPVNIRLLTQKIRNQADEESRDRIEPTSIRKLLRSMAGDGKDTADDDPCEGKQQAARNASGKGNIELRRLDAEHEQITFHQSWQALKRVAERRARIAELLLKHLTDSLPSETRGKDLLAETTMGKMREAMLSDIDIRSIAAGREDGGERMLTRTLLWLHEQGVIRLNKGMAVFRQAMNIRLEAARKQFSQDDYKPLRLHYDNQVQQIHIMDEFAQRGIRTMREARQLARDYFEMDYERFLKTWLEHSRKELTRQTTAASWHRIVESLDNPVQQKIISVDPDRVKNELVLAGPGSGKTRVLVHRIAYLVRVLRERPESIIALAYNRHAAIEIRKRLHQLIGEDSWGVMVMTTHAMAMRLTGSSFVGRPQGEMPDFDQVIQDATAMLTGEGRTSIDPDEADETRDRLLGGFRWVLIDEYQDIDRYRYELISALVGRTLRAPDDEGEGQDARRLHIFAVGDDDQNIYAFNESSVEYIRQFQEDYGAETTFLVENYRSTAHIIEAANRVIQPAANRMKAASPVTVNRARAGEDAGGMLATLDPVAGGRVQVLSISPDPDAFMTRQATAIMLEFERLKRLDDKAWNWSTCAVIAREWKYLHAVRAWCDIHGIPVHMASEQSLSVWRLRETQQLVQQLRETGSTGISPQALKEMIARVAPGIWRDLLDDAAEQYAVEHVNFHRPANSLIEWLAEWAREARRQQHGLMLASAHATKGLEFEHVAILDGGWSPRSTRQGGDPDEARRLFYVAMTRARKSLMMAWADPHHAFVPALRQTDAVLWRDGAPGASAPLDRRLQRQYRVPPLEEIDLGYSGRQSSAAPVHASIAAARPGDPVELRLDGNGWYLFDRHQRPIGKMARKFTLAQNMRFVSGTIRAIIRRTKADEQESYRQHCKCERWEVVVPELVLERG